MSAKATDWEAHNEALKVKRKPSQTDKAVDLIRSKIIDLSVAPGSRIDERLLIDLFKLGRTPAREAINRLQAEGLVTIVPDRGGKYVRELNFREIGEVLMAHQLAESMLAALCDFSDPSLARDLRKLQEQYVKAVEDRDYLNITEINQAFHLRLFRSIDNGFLYEFAQSIHRHVRRLLVMIYRLEATNPKIHSEQFEANLAQHWAIIDMVERQDRQALNKALPEHARHTETRLTAFLNRQATRGADLDFLHAGISPRK